MRIRSFTHAGLERLYRADQTTGVPANAVKKLRLMLQFLQRIEGAHDLRALGIWKAHALTGNRKGTWSFHVTANWRLTFRVDNNELIEVNLEDYH